VRRGKTIIAGRELAARDDGGGGARLYRRVDLRRAHGAGGSTKRRRCGSKRAAVYGNARSKQEISPSRFKGRR